MFDGRGRKRWVGGGYLEEGACLRRLRHDYHCISGSLDHPHLHLLFNLHFRTVFFFFFEHFQRASASFNIAIGFLPRWRLLHTSSISLMTKSNQRANQNSLHDTDETTEFTDASPTLRGMMHDPGTFI